MSLLCYSSVTLAKALPSPVITGSNSHHTLTSSRRPNMFCFFFSPTLRIYSLNYGLSLYRAEMQFQPGLAKTSICLFDLIDFLEWGLQTHTHTHASYSRLPNTPTDLWRCGQRSGCCRSECVLSVVTSSNSSHHCGDNHRVCMLRGTPLSLFLFFFYVHLFLIMHCRGS